MTKHYKALTFALLGTVLVFGLSLLIAGNFSKIANAAISVFSPTTCYTASATSSPAYMTTGAATSTVSCFLGAEGARTATIAVEVNASSTLSVFDHYIEESMNGIDWFPVSAPQSASSSPVFSPALKSTFTYTFASSTIGATALGASSNQLGVNGTNNRNHYSFDVPVRMKYVRVISALAPSSASGAVWAQIISRQDTN